jgi:hypothetical protein
MLAFCQPTGRPAVGQYGGSRPRVGQALHSSSSTTLRRLSGCLAASNREVELLEQALDIARETADFARGVVAAERKAAEQALDFARETAAAERKAAEQALDIAREAAAAERRAAEQALDFARETAAAERKAAELALDIASEAAAAERRAASEARQRYELETKTLRTQLALERGKLNMRGALGECVRACMRACVRAAGGCWDLTCLSQSDVF